ncbi:MAG: hypothetical protein M1819_004482 [Sarea resinae]|nr:MAG: hypothetical protein M1819_004482 [Sarea resinae]
MSSSQPFVSSPHSLTASSSRRRKSRFTYKHLAQLGLSSTTCPLRVIAHIDLDAFYAQCEMVRLGISEDQPLAVQQWQGLIAINYPARKFGLSRHVNIAEAKKLCPELIMQHVATWKEGDEKWAYHDDAAEHIATHKVSLDPYRLESRRILAAIKEVLPAPPVQRVEKASIDEVFLDLSAQVHSILLDRYHELRGPPPYDDPTENLPPPPSTALDWKTDALVDLDEKETEDDDPDWDDIAMLIGSEIVASVRAGIRERLKYTCSAGVGRNKMIAKLGSAHRKPNQQTIVRNRAVYNFLGSFKFTKIRNLGGKLGDQVVALFNTDTVKDLLDVPMDQLRKKLGDDTGTWVYQTIRGEDSSEVNSRTQIKSMLSAKSFRPSINTQEQAVRWLRIFVADIFSRLVEDGVLEHRRRPKTINLHHRQSGQMRSRQAPIPQGKTIDENILFDLAQSLLIQIMAEGRAWPCANLSLSVGGFDDGVTGNKGIGAFLVRGDEAAGMNSAGNGPQHRQWHVEDGPPEKKRKVENVGIQRFLAKSKEIQQPEEQRKRSHDSEDPSGGIGALLREDSSGIEQEADVKKEADMASSGSGQQKQSGLTNLDDLSRSKEEETDTYICSRCNNELQRAEQAEHDDWHFAKDIEAQERSPGTMEHSANASDSRHPTTTTPRVSQRPAGLAAARQSKRPTSAGSRGKGIGKVEKGQGRLTFGR